MSHTSIQYTHHEEKSDSMSSKLVSAVSSVLSIFDKPIPFAFQKKHKLEDRISESSKVSVKYPDRIPVICEVSPNQQDSIQLDRHKFLVPADITVGQFLFTIRRRIKLPPEKALFIFTENQQLPPISMFISQIYNTYKNPDGFLYFSINTETVFG